jgi:uncharacterized membrane protein
MNKIKYTLLIGSIVSFIIGFIMAIISETYKDNVNSTIEDSKNMYRNAKKFYILGGIMFVLFFGLSMLSK